MEHLLRKSNDELRTFRPVEFTIRQLRAFAFAMRNLISSYLFRITNADTHISRIADSEEQRKNELQSSKDELHTPCSVYPAPCTVFILLFMLVLMLFSTFFVSANNIRINGTPELTLVSDEEKVTFFLSWDNSWRDEYNCGAGGNYPFSCLTHYRGWGIKVYDGTDNTGTLLIGQPYGSLIDHQVPASNHTLTVTVPENENTDKNGTGDNENVRCDCEV